MSADHKSLGEIVLPLFEQQVREAAESLLWPVLFYQFVEINGANYVSFKLSLSPGAGRAGNRRLLGSKRPPPTAKSIGKGGGEAPHLFHWVLR